MNNKVMLLLFLMVLFLSPFVFSENQNCVTVNDVGKTFNHEDKICVCVLSEENDIDEYCNYNVSDSVKPVLSSLKSDLSKNNFDCNNTDLDLINLKISDLKNQFSELIELHSSIIEKRELLQIYLKEYVVCKEESSGLKPSIGTGRFILNSELNSNTLSKSNTSVYNNSNLDEYLINDDLIDSANNLISTTNSIIEDKPTNECDEIKTKIITVKDEIKILIENVKETKNLNKENLKQIKNLIQEKNLILKECYHPTPSFNCKDDLSNLNNYRLELFTKLQNFKHELSKVDENSSDYLELKNKFSRVNNEYLGLLKKINALSENCALNDYSLIKSNIKPECTDKQNALEDIDSLKKELNDTNDVDLIYVLKTKLEFLQNKYDAISCSVSENDVEVVNCIQSLNVSDNLSKDEIINICKDEKNVEYQKRLVYINKLNLEIKDKEQKLNSLTSKISSIKERLQTEEDNDEKLKLIVENKIDILDDTTLKIENRISDIKKQIELLDLSKMNQELKDSQINALNERIASLEQIKDSLSLASDVTEFKEIINSAREDDILSKKIKNNSVMLSEIDSIDTMILDKHFLNNKDYNLLKNNLLQIRSKLLKMDVNSDDFALIKEELDNFKQDLREYYVGGNN